MTDRFIYPEIISTLLRSCHRHISGAVSADELQHVIQHGESGIIALEEQDIRDFLSNIEGRLEFIKFTVNSDRQVQETRAVAQDVVSWLNERGMM